MSCNRSYLQVKHVHTYYVRKSFINTIIGLFKYVVAFVAGLKVAGIL